MLLEQSHTGPWWITHEQHHPTGVCEVLRGRRGVRPKVEVYRREVSHSQVIALALRSPLPAQ